MLKKISILLIIFSIILLKTPLIEASNINTVFFDDFSNRYINNWKSIRKDTYWGTEVYAPNGLGIGALITADKRLSLTNINANNSYTLIESFYPIPNATNPFTVAYSYAVEYEVEIDASANRLDFGVQLDSAGTKVTIGTGGSGGDDFKLRLRKDIQPENIFATSATSLTKGVKHKIRVTVDRMSETDCRYRVYLNYMPWPVLDYSRTSTKNSLNSTHIPRIRFIGINSNETGLIYIDNFGVYENTVDGDMIANPIEDTDLSVTVKDEVINTLDGGLGFNIYCRPGIQWHNMDYHTDNDWEVFYDILKWQEPSIIRYGGLMNSDFIDENNSFTVNTDMMRFHLKMADYMEERKIPYYFSGWDKNLNWVNSIGDIDINTYTDALLQLAQYMLNVKQSQYFLGFSFLNEPDGVYYQLSGWENNFFDTHRIFADKLEIAGLRERIKIFGGETTTYWNLNKEIETYNKYIDYMDTISIHEYKPTSEWDILNLPNNMIKTAELLGSDYITRIQNQKANFDGKPIIIGEFGARATYNDNLSDIEFVSRAINLGVNGAMYWKFSSGSQGVTDRSLLYNVPGYRLKPNANMLYPVAALNKYTKVDSQVYKPEVSGGMDENGIQRVFVNAFKTPDGNWTLKFINNGFNEKSVVLTFEPLSEKEAFNIITLSEGEKESGLKDGGSITLYNNQLTFNLKPRGVTILTTFPKGNLQLPETIGSNRLETAITILNVSHSQMNNEIEVELSATNNTSINRKAKLVLAVYHGNEMLNVGIEDIDFNSYEKKAIKKIVSTENASIGNYEVKAFLFESINNIKPVTVPSSYK